MPHRRREWPAEENTNEGSFGNGNASFSFVVGFRLMENVDFPVRLENFDFAKVGTLRIESDEGVFKRPLDSSDGAEPDIKVSAMLSVIVGV